MDGYITTVRIIDGGLTRDELVGAWPQTTSITRDVLVDGAVNRNGDLITITLANGSAEYRITSEDDALDLIRCELVTVRP